MLPNLARFFEHVNIFFAELRLGMRGVVRVDELRQPKRASHPSRPAANDHDIGRHLRPLDAFNRFAKNQHKKTSATD